MKAIELTGMKGMKGIGSNSFESGKGGLSQRRRERRESLKSGGEERYLGKIFNPRHSGNFDEVVIVRNPALKSDIV